jgi:predicted MFS family arabinose efflux permease
MRRLLLLVGAIVFVDTMFFAALTPLLPSYKEDLGLSKSEAGVLASSYAAGALFGALPGGIAAARIGVKPVVLFGLAGMGATTLAFGLADSFWLLLAARFLQGLSSAFSWTASFSWLAAGAPPHRRGELLGAAVGAAIFGALFGPVLGGVASETGSAPAFGSVAVFAVALGIWAWRTPAFAPGEPQSARVVLRALLHPGVAGAVWFVALPALLFGVLGVLAPLRLDELGWGSLAIGAVFLTAAAIEGIASPVLGRVSDRRGPITPLRAGLLASALVAAVLPWLGAAWLLAAVVVAAALAFGTFWAPAMALLANSAEAVGLEYAYAFALMNTAWAPGAFAGAAIGGAVADFTADAVPYLALSAACLLTLAVVSRTPRPA